jgi:catechol 2,3-dioxygenase-like lactoylglutathione lyase family enzyme
MARAVQPVLITADVDRLVRFYTDLLDAEQAIRFPEDGALFYVGLRIGTGILGSPVPPRRRKAPSGSC